MSSAKAEDAQGVSEWAIDVSAIVKGAEPTKKSAITPAQIFREYTWDDYLGRTNVIAGQVITYRRAHERISVSLVEYRQHRWAVSGTTYEKATPIPLAAPGASFGWVRSSTARGPVIAGTKGRIGIEVAVASSPGSALAGSAQLELARKLYSRQFAAVPVLSDLQSSSPTQIGQQFAEHLGIGVLAAGLILSVVGWLVGWWSDIGSREWLRNNRYGDRSRPGLVDVTPTVRRGNVLRSLVPSARMTVLAGVEGLLLAAPGVRVFTSFLIVSAFALVWGLIESLFRRRKAKGAVAHGQVAAIVTGIGAGASAVVVAGGLGFMSAGISAMLLVPGWFSVRIWVPLLLVGFTVIGWSRRPIRLARRLLQPVVREQIEADVRRPILLLRSFQDDALEVRPSTTVGSRDGFAEEPYVRFEEMVAWETWQFGSLRAAGQPGTVLEPLGAVRDYYSDDDWQKAVEKGAEDAIAIVLVVGRSPSLVWEIENLRAHARLAKTVFVIPPVSQVETGRRLAVLASALELDPEKLLQPSDRRIPVVLTFDEDGWPLIYAVAGRTSDAYSVALSRALAAIPDRPRPVSSSAGSFRRAGADITEHLLRFDPHDQPGPRKPLIRRLASAALWLVPV